MLRRNMKLGELLVEAGVIDPLQLQSALSCQQNWGGRLGTSLVRLGYVSEERLLGFIAGQLELPRIDLGQERIPEEILAFVPAEKAREYGIIPVDRKVMHGTLYLVIAMDDPANLILVDDLQFMTGCRVFPVLASAAAIRAAIERSYGPAGEPAPPIPPAVVAGREARSPEEKLERLLKILLDEGILSFRDYERLR